MFLAEVNKFPILTKEEKLIITKQAKQGDEKAIVRLIETNLRLVLMVVFKLWRPGYPLMDMISEGYFGLIKAVKVFDHDKGFSFTTYAVPWIKYSAIKAIVDNNNHHHISLDEPVYEDEDKTLKDFLVSKEPQADEILFNSQIKGRIKSILSLLNSRERKVVVFRFWHDLTLEQIGDIVGLKKERTRQIEAKALRKLRRAMYANGY